MSATFECALTRAKKGEKGKNRRRRAFRPANRRKKTYKLKPGKYTFSVRAVSAGAVDPSPATRRFRVVHVGH